MTKQDKEESCKESLSSYTVFNRLCQTRYKYKPYFSFWEIKMPEELKSIFRHFYR
ncbi:hypothetical protein HMPREF2533_00961 [Bacteroides fragilis]|nr:hypothetical protein M069_2553 [Bacteroides fragilis str. B1 (UDC16-1)]KXU48937.1 hypothetical protein HMPREF2530_00961 [Bacteroides fragilis]KXU49031.1 hypothetical protein HMPREF2533_00961 [Bacteroides fragilis]